MIPVEKQTLSGYTFIDLFAGIGGFRIALESFGSECVFSSEWDKYARNVYKTNFGNLPAGDITKIRPSDIPDCDIVCAGFPCQTFSIAGKKEGFNNIRGTLFFNIAEIVGEKQPKIILLENVKNLMRHDNGRTFDVIRSKLQALGYSTFYNVLNSADYGIPQKRERTYIVCFRNDLGICNFRFPKKTVISKCVSDVVLNDRSLIADLYRDDVCWKQTIQNNAEKKTTRN